MRNKKFGFNLLSMLAVLMLTAFSTFMVFISISYPVFAADVTVSRSMTDRVDPLGTLTVSFSISPSKTLNNFDLAELMPQAWSIKDWSVSGFDKSNIALETQTSQSFMAATYKGYHWKFNAALSSAVTLTYTLDVPVSSGSYKFVGIWTYAGGFDKDEKTLSVAVAPPTTTTTVPPTTTTVPGVTTTLMPPFVPPGDMTIYVIGAVAGIAIIVLFALWKKGKLKLKLWKKGSNPLGDLGLPAQ